MRSIRLPAVCYRRAAYQPSHLHATCTDASSATVRWGVPCRLLHRHTVLRSLRKKVVPAADTSDSTSSASQPARAPSPSQPSSLAAITSFSSSSSRPAARSAPADLPSSFSFRSSSVSSVSSSRPAHRRAGTVTSFRRREDLIRHARKRDDDCSDPSWRWRMGVIVERLPTALNPPPAWELEWEQHIERKEARTAIPIPDALKPLDEPEVDPTAVDPSTADDISDNRHSLTRRARDSLYLLVQKSNGHTGEAMWTFPSVRYTALPYADITPKEAAASSIRSTTGDSLAAHTLSHAPIGYHRYEYSPQYRSAANTQLKGGKLFLFHALYLSGTVDLNEQRSSADSRSRYTDYVWVPRSQLHDYITDRELLHLAVDVLMTDADYADETDVQQLEKQQRDRQHNIVYPQQPDKQRDTVDRIQPVAEQLSATSADTVQQRQTRRIQHIQ